VNPYRYRFYPTKGRAGMLEHTFGSVRFVYNNALGFSKEQYGQGSEATFSDWNKNLIALKKDADFAWLKYVSSVPLQQPLRHFDKAFFK
jgi:putative transposase